jgi:hypothetical protein
VASDNSTKGRKRRITGIMVGMLRIIGLALFSVLLTGCGYDGQYRYTCQDPVNWDNKECNPPICEPTGTCSRDLVGQETWDEYQKTKGVENE